MYPYSSSLNWNEIEKRIRGDSLIKTYPAYRLVNTLLYIDDLCEMSAFSNSILFLISKKKKKLDQG